MGDLVTSSNKSDEDGSDHYSDHTDEDEETSLRSSSSLALREKGTMPSSTPADGELAPCFHQLILLKDCFFFVSQPREGKLGSLPVQHTTHADQANQLSIKLLKLI